MRTMTATEASRKFSDLLDAVEHGETVTITRGNRPIAEIGPTKRHTGKELSAALADVPRLDAHFESDIAGALAYLNREENDPWADA